MEAEKLSRMQQAETSDCVAFLREVSVLQERIGAALGPLGLTLREFEVLQCLAAGSLNQAAIGDQLNRSKVSVCRCLARLNEEGWVNCRRPPADKRVCFVELTAEGNDRLEVAQSCIAALLGELNTCLGDKEQRFFSRISNYLSRFAGAEAEVRSA